MRLKEGIVVLQNKVDSIITKIVHKLDVNYSELLLVLDFFDIRIESIKYEEKDHILIKHYIMSNKFYLTEIYNILDKSKSYYKLLKEKEINKMNDKFSKNINKYDTEYLKEHADELSPDFFSAHKIWFDTSRWFDGSFELENFNMKKFLYKFRPFLEQYYKENLLVIEENTLEDIKKYFEIEEL